MTFLAGDALSDAIRKVLAEPGARCAVAFWGAGSETLLTGSDARVVCNLKAGGTNPFALRKLQVAELLQCDDLHAKVYLGSDHAIVTSANASANGLGLEAGEQAGWQEAGVRVAEIEPIEAWFDAICAKSREITDDDWLAAEAAWRRRQIAKPTRSTFAAFDTDGDGLPLMAWAGDAEWQQSEEDVKQQLGFCDENTERWINDGMELEGPGDEKVLKGQWILTWMRGVGGKPSKRVSPWWIQLSDTVVKDAFRHAGENEKRSVVLGVDKRAPEPFDPTEPRFVAALTEVVARPKYHELRTLDYEGAWFGPRLSLIAACWRDVKACYLQKAAE